MVDYLNDKKIPVEKIEINATKLQNPVRKMEAFLVKDQTLKDTAQRAVSHYARATYFMKHKDIFNVQALDFESFSKSLGLNVPPRIRFLDRMNKKQQTLSEGSVGPQINLSKGENKKIYFGNDENEDGSGSDTKVKEDTKTEVQKLMKSKEKRTSEDSDNDVESDDDTKQPKLSKVKPKPSNVNNFSVSDTSKVNFSVSDSESEDDLLKSKRQDHDIEMPQNLEPIETFLGKNKKKKAVTKAALVKKMMKKNIVANKKILFDDDGGTLIQGAKERKSELAKEFENEDEGGIDIEKAKLVLREEDKFDKQMFKAKVKAKHKEEKRKLKEQKRLEREGERDDFGESESDEGPDLSWLPDPDKIYGKKGEDENDTVENTVDENKLGAHEIEKDTSKTKKEKKAKKRKAKGMDDLKTVLKRKKKQRLEQLSADLNVNETEELALMLLKGKK